MANQELHPIVVYGRSRGWRYPKIAKFLGVSDVQFRKIVTGWQGLSFSRANTWELKTKGAVRAIDLMRWHERNRRTQPSERAS